MVTKTNIAMDTEIKYLYIPNITAKYCHFIYPSDSVTLLREC